MLFASCSRDDSPVHGCGWHALQVVAEMIATFLLVFVTCGSAALSKSNPGLVSQLGASVAGGLIVTVMIYAVGHISGAHMNPAVTLAFAVARHFPWIQVRLLFPRIELLQGIIFCSSSKMMLRCKAALII